MAVMNAMQEKVWRYRILTIVSKNPAMMKIVIPYLDRRNTEVPMSMEEAIKSSGISDQDAILRARTIINAAEEMILGFNDPELQESDLEVFLIHDYYTYCHATGLPVTHESAISESGITNSEIIATAEELMDLWDQAIASIIELNTQALPDKQNIS